MEGKGVGGGGSKVMVEQLDDLRRMSGATLRINGEDGFQE